MCDMHDDKQYEDFIRPKFGEGQCFSCPDDIDSGAYWKKIREIEESYEEK